MKKFTRILALLLAVVALFSVANIPVNAASNGLGITPRKNYTIKPGDNISDTLYLSNLSISDDLIVSIRVLDFAAQNETGAPALQLDDDAPAVPWSLKPFTTIPSTIRVAAGKSTNVPIKITIPSEQGAGSYYAAIEYKAVNAETEQKVNIAASSASLIFVTVPGQAKEQMVLKQFGAFVPVGDGTNGSFKTLFMGSEPEMLAFRLENKGNIAEQPNGSVVVKNMFGRTVLEIEKANPKDQLALIGQTRRFETCLKTSVVETKASTGQQGEQVVCTDANLWPGRYTAQLATYYGINGNNTQEILATTTFWYLPWWFIIVVIVAIAAIAGIVWLIYRNIRGAHRRYRR